MRTIIDKYKTALPEIMKAVGTKNVHGAPRIMKVVVSSGTGRTRDKARNELVSDRLAKITGQHPSPRPAKKSIATFKLREGEIIGHMVTLRGERMRSFLDKMINVAIPRMRDFRGIDPKSIDALGNVTIGFKEHTVFPETADEDLKDIFGLSVTIETTAKNKKDAETLLRAIGVPFKKERAKQ